MAEQTEIPAEMLKAATKAVNDRRAIIGAGMMTSDEFARLALEAANVGALLAERDGLRASLIDYRNSENERFLDWRDVTGAPCTKCRGAGRCSYPDTSTYMGGLSAQSFTSDVCDRCWGTGSEEKRGVDLRALRTRIAELEGDAKTFRHLLNIAQQVYGLESIGDAYTELEQRRHEVKMLGECIEQMKENAKQAADALKEAR